MRKEAAITLYVILKMSGKEKIILGLDPGTRIMGYGLLMVKDVSVQALDFGVINLHKFDNYALKLREVFDRMINLVDEFHPDEAAFEAPFYGKNVQSMLKLGRMQGVAMAAALYRNVPIFEYAPRKVKQSITGNGNASKEQVARMLVQQLQLGTMPKFMDATDALAVAVCHNAQNGKHTPSKKTWSDFVRKHPDRIKKLG